MCHRNLESLMTGITCKQFFCRTGLVRFRVRLQSRSRTPDPITTTTTRSTHRFLSSPFSRWFLGYCLLVSGLDVFGFDPHLIDKSSSKRLRHDLKTPESVRVWIRYRLRLLLGPGDQTFGPWFYSLTLRDSFFDWIVDHHFLVGWLDCQSRMGRPNLPMNL